MSYKKSTWVEKYRKTAAQDYPKVVKIEGNLSRKWGEGTLVIPGIDEVKSLMVQVPEGKLTTINEIREALAEKHHATIGCPIVTGIFAWIVANVADEEAKEGREKLPYWRTLKTGGEINPKYPGGVEKQKKLLEKEGHRVTQKGKRLLVADYAEKIANLKAF